MIRLTKKEFGHKRKVSQGKRSVLSPIYPYDKLHKLAGSFYSRELNMDLLSHFKQNPLPFARLLGLELISVEPDRVVAEMSIREELCTSPAVAHSGAIIP